MLEFSQKAPVQHDYEDVFVKETYFQKSDLILATEEKVTTKYISDPSEDIWITRTIGKNAAGETIYIKITRIDKTPDSWIPPALLS